MAVDPEISRAHMREELAAARPMASAYHWGLIPDFTALTLLATMYAYNDYPYIVTMKFDDYREMPPWIDFIDPETGEVGVQRAYPKTHDSFSYPHWPCLCAPFSRKAYKGVAGPNAPHGDWDLSGWATSKANNVDWSNHATIGGMLSMIQRRLQTPDMYLGRR